ncbi:MAG: HNH endonuclease [Pirellulales bacterium]|nr:HNH endonuclease [Pirellulales bacterium]
MSTAQREEVRQRAGGRCGYCRLPEQADEWPFHIDHVIAQQHGGSNDIGNLCWACSRCNLNNGPNLTSLEAGAASPVSLFSPRSQQWEEHFRFDQGRVVGITPTGRVTVRLLGMNSSTRVELRRQLAAIGECF